MNDSGHLAPSPGRGTPCGAFSPWQGVCPAGRYFLLVQKVTKDTLRGQPAGWTRPKERARSTGRASP